MNIPSLISSLALNAPGFADRLASAGLIPASITSANDLNALPVMRKEDLVEIQATRPPFGGFLACSPGDLKRIFQSPGPIQDPEARVSDYWRWKSALLANDFRPGDVVINCFSYHMTPAGAMFEEGLWAVGCTVIPSGIGNQEQQAHILHDLKVIGYVGLPSYLKALIEKAEDLGLEIYLKKAFFTAEPLPISLRSWLNEHGIISARQGYGTAECGNLGFECEQENGWHIPEDTLVHVCDLNSGQPLPEGETGEIVITLLNHVYALVRFGTGDLSSIDHSPCACGLSSARLMGWQGHIGDAVKVRGMFLHPRQVGDVVSRFPEISHWQVVVTRAGHKDFLSLVVVPSLNSDLSSLSTRLAKEIRDTLKFQITVELVNEDVLTSGSPQIRDERTWE